MYSNRFPMVVSVLIIFFPIRSNRTRSGDRRKVVVFADGIAPGEGTSASENSSFEDDNNPLKSKKLSTRAKNKKSSKNSTSPPSNDMVNSFLCKENAFDLKVN